MRVASEYASDYPPNLPGPLRWVPKGGGAAGPLGEEHWSVFTVAEVRPPLDHRPPLLDQGRPIVGRLGGALVGMSQGSIGSTPGWKQPSRTAS